MIAPHSGREARRDDEVILEVFRGGATPPRGPWASEGRSIEGGTGLEYDKTREKAEAEPFFFRKHSPGCSLQAAKMAASGWRWRPGWPPEGAGQKEKLSCPMVGARLWWHIYCGTSLALRFVIAA
jgi:hypothetical protein